MADIMYVGLGDVNDTPDDVSYVAVGNHPIDVITLDFTKQNEYWSFY